MQGHSLPARIQRPLVALAIASTLLATTAPSASAECFNSAPDADEPLTIGYAFVATVTEASENVDPIEEMAAFDWHVELSVERTYLGQVPDSIVYNGWEYGCHELRGEGLHTGDRIFVATENLNIGYLPRDPFGGDVVAWRSHAGGWRFYEDAVLSGANEGSYPQAARDATTQAEILAIVASAAQPDTSTMGATDDQAEAIASPLRLLAAFGMLILSLLWGRGSPLRSPDIRRP